MSEDIPGIDVTAAPSGPGCAECTATKAVVVKSNETRQPILLASSHVAWRGR